MSKVTRDSSKVIGGKQPVRDVQFINYDFDDATKTAFKAWLSANSEAVWDGIDKLVDSNYSVSIKWDGFNRCYGCFVTPAGSDHVHAGFILTGRGRSAQSAVAGALYRHHIIFDGSWPIEGVQRNRLADDD